MGEGAVARLTEQMTQVGLERVDADPAPFGEHAAARSSQCLVEELPLDASEVVAARPVFDAARDGEPARGVAVGGGCCVGALGKGRRARRWARIATWGDVLHGGPIGG